jgi:hypothetical protein
MKNLMHRFIRSSSIGPVCLALFSLVLVCHIPPSVMSQDASHEDMMEKVQKRQSKMMETQFLMMQLMQLGHSTDLQKELEIIDDQVDSVKKLAQDYQQAMMDFSMKNGQKMKDVQKLIADGEHEVARKLSEEFQQMHQDMSNEYMEKAKETLLPHQIERLLQISKQQRVKSMNRFSDEFGIPAALADEIGLSKEEKEKLIETIKEARKKYYAEVEVLKNEANEKIMGALTSEQQEKMREILGETYDQEKSRRRNMENIRAKQNKRAKERESKKEQQEEGS